MIYKNYRIKKTARHYEAKQLSGNNAITLKSDKVEALMDLIDQADQADQVVTIDFSDAYQVNQEHVIAVLKSPNRVEVNREEYTVTAYYVWLHDAFTDVIRLLDGDNVYLFQDIPNLKLKARCKWGIVELK